jgi:soluble P-type ATPase
MAPMRDLELVEALHEPGRRRREESHSLSTEEDQKLLTSSPTVHGLNARPKLEVEAFHEATDREPSRLAARGVSDAAVNIRACEPIRAAATGDRSRSGNRPHRPDARPNLEVEAAREPERRAPTRLVEAQSIRAASECGAPASSGSTVHVAINGRYRGCFQLAGALRPETDRLIRRLSRDYELALLSGDHATERERFAGLFGATARLHFNQSPLDKLGFIRQLQERGRTVMMVGDGLNDAGALQQSDVGVAVVENVGAFSPASDVIASSGTVPQLAGVLRFARDAVRVVRAAFVVSAAYNVIGVAIAASGRLSPVVCAVLMPLSSITVVAFACGATAWAARRGAQGKTFAKDVEPKPSRLNHEEEAPA